MKRKVFMLIVVWFLLVSFVGTAEAIDLTFTHWGGNLEIDAIKKMCEKYTKEHPGVNIKPLFVPWDQYVQKLSAMISGGTPPQVGYVMETEALEWAEKGVLLDILPLIEKESDPSVKLKNRLRSIWWLYGGGKKTLGTSVAAEVMITWYNKEIFDKEGVPYPPTDPNKWTWNQFVETAVKLTVDKNGKHPNEPGFDPTKIERFGVTFGNWYMVWFPFIWSNGGDLCDESGKIAKINKPEAVDALQNLCDLIYKYHVAPTPAQSSALPSYSIALQTGRVAMAIDGQWTLQELGQLEKQGKLKLGVAPLPKFKRPVTAVIGTPIGIYADAVKDSDTLKAAWEFYKWITNSESAIDLVRCGLWMPIQTWWYTDPKYIQKWLDPEIHPSEYKAAVISYAYRYAKPAPTYYLKNFAQINDIMYQELSNAFNGKVTVQEACNRIVEKIKPLLVGRYDKP